MPFVDIVTKETLEAGFRMTDPLERYLRSVYQVWMILGGGWKRELENDSTSSQCSRFADKNTKRKWAMILRGNEVTNLMKVNSVFPIVEKSGSGESVVISPGLTKREYFIAAAMTGLGANPYVSASTVDALSKGRAVPSLATMAIGLADEILRQIEESTNGSKDTEGRSDGNSGR
jgi:hypothetical protein